MFTCLTAMGCLVFLAVCVSGQAITDTLPKKLTVQQIASVTQDIEAKATAQIEAIETQWQARTGKLKKQEEKILQWLQQTDKQAADALGKLDGLQLTDLTNRWKNGQTAAPYLARLDTLKTLLGFHESLQLPQVAEAEALLKKLQSSLGGAEEANSWLQQRQNALFEALRKQTKLPPDISKAFDKWKGEAAVWKAQVAHYKEVLNSPEKIEREALKILQKQPFFQQFMAKHGELARLFGPPAGADAAGAGNPISGLQTRQSLMQELQTRFGAAALQSGGALQQQIQNGMDQLSDQQALQLGNILENAGLPKPENAGELQQTLSPAQQEKAGLKSKSFKERLEIGWNLQSATRIQNFGAIRDVGLSIGYKLNPRSVAGVGIAYKFALGESWQKLKWTHEGVGFRSFIDWRVAAAGSKLLQGIWLTGGFEMNYWSRIASDVRWKDLAWETNIKIGLTKKFTISKKTTGIQVLFNITNFKKGLSMTEPVEFRIFRII